MGHPFSCGLQTREKQVLRFAEESRSAQNDNAIEGLCFGTFTVASRGHPSLRESHLHDFGFFFAGELFHAADFFVGHSS